ncbi:acetyltransferase [Magnetospirillum moscoviense]|uniref:Sugar acetyltransferase n=1 Tax=Magnetospirillum moscoviense TaxID=1437059 RepID=A0A178MWA9_9PROT|nr:acetyltransferase [Magnetospirillum moscoviense]OAN55001.1 sugar acetyltransferase [Magnetospirillum moscoviense]
MQVFVIGAGGHAKVVIDALRRAGTTVDGLVDADPGRVGSTVLGVPVLGGDEALERCDRQRTRVVNGIGAVGPADLRAKVFAAYRARGFVFATLVDPSAVVGGGVVLDEGAQILAGAVVQTGCRVGCDAIVNTRAAIDHDCHVGAHAHIAPGAVLSGDVRIGERTLVGTGATVIQGIRIGSGALVAAGAVVICDVADGARVAGNPARPIGDEDCR